MVIETKIKEDYTSHICFTYKVSWVIKPKPCKKVNNEKLVSLSLLGAMDVRDSVQFREVKGHECNCTKAKKLKKIIKTFILGSGMDLYL